MTEIAKDDLALGARLATEEQKLHQLRGVCADVSITTHERSLEVALAAVAQLWENLEGVELRDAVTRLFSDLENEIRSKSILTAAILMSIGVEGDDEMIVSLTNRASA